MHVGDGVAQTMCADAAKTKQRSGITRWVGVRRVVVSAAPQRRTNSSVSTSAMRRAARGRFAKRARARFSVNMTEKGCRDLLTINI